jgi:hypothetical protein
LVEAPLRLARRPLALALEEQAVTLGTVALPFGDVGHRREQLHPALALDAASDQLDRQAPAVGPLHLELGQQLLALGGARLELGKAGDELAAVR